MTESKTCCNTAWEAAYLRFETPAQEIAKFDRRLRRLGALNWPRDSQIVDLCCGRGNGLLALHQLGFSQLEGVDLSASLLEQVSAPATCHLADCRRMPFLEGSKDIVLVQGGLHHLETLPDDLRQTLSEARRVLRPGGRFVAVEPWLTPFLHLTHALCRNKLARRLVVKLDALAVMIENEAVSYFNWLSRSGEVRQLLLEHFHAERLETGWGKMFFVGIKHTR